MVTSEQKSFLQLHGYRVDTTCHQPASYTVEYPRVRSGAFGKRYSLEVFTSPSAAWQHAWTDATQSPAVSAKWYQHQAQLAEADMNEPFLPMDDFECQPA